MFRQSTEDFIRCLENAFHHFGGSVKTLVIDNLRAAVTKADWYEPELHPKCERYKTGVSVGLEIGGDGTGWAGWVGDSKLGLAEVGR